MGNIIEFKNLNSVQKTTSQLLVYKEEIKSLSAQTVSVNKVLAEKLLSIVPKSRSMKLSGCFRSLLAQYPDNVVIKNIDVMFNPTYQVDVLEILTEARKNKSYSIIWPGKYKNGFLIYGEESYPDYKTYKIKNYNIIYVI